MTMKGRLTGFFFGCLTAISIICLSRGESASSDEIKREDKKTARVPSEAYIKYREQLPASVSDARWKLEEAKALEGDAAAISVPGVYALYSKAAPRDSGETINVVIRFFPNSGEAAGYAALLTGEIREPHVRNLSIDDVDSAVLVERYFSSPAAVPYPPRDFRSYIVARRGDIVFNFNHTPGQKPPPRADYGSPPPAVSVSELAGTHPGQSLEEVLSEHAGGSIDADFVRNFFKQFDGRGK